MLIFSYMPTFLKRPAPTLNGAMVRYLPLLAVTLEGPGGSWPIDSRVDSGSDDTIFHVGVASKIGLDLSGAPVSECQAVGGAIIPIHCARVGLRISDGKETCVWQAMVGFIHPPRRHGLLGLSGFLDYFESRLLGNAREIHLLPNSSFPGQHIIH